MGLHLALIAGIVIILGLLLLQIRSWRTGLISVTRRQVGLRVACALIMMVVLGMFLAADFIVISGYGPLAMIGYWLIACLLGMTLMILAMLDIRESTKHYRQMRLELLRDTLETEKKGDKEENSEP